jgi:hypothetical protein
MAIFTQYENKVEILAASQDLSRIAVKRLSDGATYEVDTITLKADGGEKKVFAAARATTPRLS